MLRSCHCSGRCGAAGERWRHAQMLLNVHPSKPVETVLMNCVKCLSSASVGVAKGLLMTYFLPKWSNMASCRFHTLPGWKEIGLLLYTRPKWLHVESVRTYRIENWFVLLFECLPRPGWMLALRKMRTRSLFYSFLCQCKQYPSEWYRIVGSPHDCLPATNAL